MSTTSARTPVLRQVRFADLTPAELYALIKLRVDTFVVEQNAAYAELDGRDQDADVVHLWHESGGEILSVARMMDDTFEGDAVGRIGRIATTPAARGQGLAAQLVQAAIDHFAPKPVVLAAQAHLDQYYARFGFVEQGKRFEEHGIPHVWMRRG